MYLLDTNFIIHLMKGDPATLQFCKHHPMSSLNLCTIVEAELSFGAFNGTKVVENLDRLRALQSFNSWDFDSDCALIYGRTRADLKKKGIAIGPHDLLIAAVALKYQATLVTRNIAELSQIPELSVIGY